MKGIIILAALHLAGLPGLILEQQCHGEVESMVRVNVLGKVLHVATRDDCISDQRVHSGDKVWVRYRIGSIFPPIISRR